MSSLEYVRQRTPAEEKADALAKLEAAARKGEGPDSFKRDDVLWVVNGDEAKISRLAAIAAEAREERSRRIREQKAVDQLRRETDAVIVEWHQQAERDLRERAELEARRRIAERGS